MDECKTEKPTELVTERDSIRRKALDASNKAVYGNAGDKAKSIFTLLQGRNRFDLSLKLVKGKKNSLKNSCEGVIVKADPCTQVLYRLRIYVQ